MFRLLKNKKFILLSVIALCVSSCGSDTATSGTEINSSESEAFKESSSNDNSSVIELSGVAEGATLAGDYSLSMFDGVNKTGPVVNSFWENINETTYKSGSGTKQVVFIVTDKVKHFEEDESAEVQKIALDIGLIDTDLGAEKIKDYAITYSPINSDIDLIGHEAEISSRGKSGYARAILRDKVIYYIYALDFSSDEWDALTSSLSTHPLS